MYYAMNRFTVIAGREAEFEAIWRNRTSYLDSVPGFLSFTLLRGSSDNNASTTFVSHSQWETKAAFTEWTRSEAFRLAHQDARTPEGVLAGPPRFEGYSTVDLTAD